MAASRPTIAPDEDIAALLERAQVSAPISDKVVPQLLAQDVGSVAALLEAGSSAMAGGDGAAGERAGGGGGTDAAEGAAHAADGLAIAASGPRGGGGTSSAGEEHGGGAAAGGEGRGGARPQEADSGACDAQAAEGEIGGGTEVSSLDPLVPALPTSGDGTIDAAREDEEEWAAAAAAYRQVCPVRREVAVFEEYRRQAAAEGRAAAEAAAEAKMEEEEPETGSGEAAALAAPLRGLASAPGCAGTTDRVTSFSDTLRPACNATTASSSSSSSTSIAGAAAGEAAAAAPALTKSARKRLKEKARKGRRAAEAAGEPEVAPSRASPPVFKTLREKKAAQASAEGWAAEVARAEELYEELRERAPQHCRRGGKWAREKFVMAVEGEFPRARGAGVPKGTILCLGRVLDAHDEQDDAEGGRRDWEEDPLGFDTNPGLLRAMCMAFE
mmetsp:Transcript_13202/g.38927  ORF Transcript_13202/g.38927 Transcript_13202/m.38927 type:complete len:443 (+) Transcript_13202:197-1525(+)